MRLPSSADALSLAGQNQLPVREAAVGRSTPMLMGTPLGEDYFELPVTQKSEACLSGLRRHGTDAARASPSNAAVQAGSSGLEDRRRAPCPAIAGRHALTCGIVTVRQQPVSVASLEDATGGVQVIVRRTVRARLRCLLLRSWLMVMKGPSNATAVSDCLIAGQVDALTPTLVGLMSAS